MKDFITYIQESAKTKNTCQKIKDEIFKLGLISRTSRWFEVYPDKSEKHIYIAVTKGLDKAYEIDDAIKDLITAEGYKYDGRMTDGDSDMVYLRYLRVS